MATRKPTVERPRVATLAPMQIGVAQQPDGSWRWSHTPPPIELVKADRISWRPIWCAGYETDGEGKKHYHHLDCLPCNCPPGPQMWPTLCGAREMALFGGRGSAKSEATFGFLKGGNLPIDLLTMKPGFDPAHPHPADTTYLNCADYSFLVLRKNSKDLQSYFRRASRFFAALGGEMTKEPMGVTFPSGAYGIFDHLADEDAYEKYVGQEFTRIVLEEANQIPEEKRYLKIKASCRTANTHMVPQLALTFNPGGPGARWLKARFITPGGRRIPYGTAYTDPGSGQTRIAIFSSVEDNPYTLATGYDKELDSLKSDDPTLYRQWRLGDPDVQSGQFFEMFRLQPMPEEPENACHVVKPHALPAEWPIAISMDWGYSHASAVYWGAWSPKKQLHVYREFVVSRMGAREVGAEIARKSLGDLARSPNPRITLWLSHDAFHRENEGHTEAELVQQGIDSILGPGAAFVFDRTEEERLLDDKVSWESVKARAEKRRKTTCITIRNAGMKRRGNMNLIRDYMRWNPVQGESMEFNADVHRKLLNKEGEHAAQEYMRKCEQAATEVLPVLQVHYDGDALDPRDRGCEKLVVGIQAAIEKETDTEQLEKQDGDDSVDALAYMCGNFSYRVGAVSDTEQIRRKIAAISEKMPAMGMNSLIRHAERIEAQTARSHRSGGFNIPRLSRRRMAGATR